MVINNNSGYCPVNPIAMHPFNEKQLCIPLDPSVRYDPFFFAQLPGEPRIFSIRPFCIPQDLPVIHNWIRRYCGVSDNGDSTPLQPLLETYNTLLTAEYSQSLIAEVDDVPLLQLDIKRADKDEISLKEEVQPGDYSLQFLFSPSFTQPADYFVAAMEKCLQGIFHFPEVKRLFCKTYSLDKKSNRLLLNAGFILDKKVRDYTGEVNIYRYEATAQLISPQP
jgi:hypothetical protein